MNVYSKTKIKPAGKKEAFLQKQLKRAAKLRLSPWNSELLPLISVKADSNTSCTKRHISSREKVLFSELGRRRFLHIIENLTTGTVLHSIYRVAKMSFS